MSPSISLHATKFGLNAQAPVDFWPISRYQPSLAGGIGGTGSVHPLLADGGIGGTGAVHRALERQMLEHGGNNVSTSVGRSKLMSAGFIAQHSVTPYTYSQPRYLEEGEVVRRAWQQALGASFLALS